MKKIYSLFIIIIAIFLISYFFMKTIPSQTNIKPPPNWKDKNIQLTVIKRNNNFLIAYSLHDVIGDYYVGQSAVQLEPFINKRVKIEGDFPANAFDNETNTQCISNTCHQIFLPKPWENKNQTASTIHISAIQLAQ
jgi:hypothetical protein